MKRKIDFDILESLRGMAALYVCIAHCRGVLWIGGEHFIKMHPRAAWSVMDYITMSLTMLTRLSTEFVIVFFVLSGFSIAHSLRNSKEPLGFYKRRFIRLYPPYVTAIFWAMAVAWGIRAIYPHFFDGTFQTPVYDRLSTSNGLFNLKTFGYNLIYLPQMGGLLNPFWSLSHEVIFYLLAPFMFRNKRVYYVCSVGLFAVINVLFSMRTIHFHQYLITDFLYYNFYFAVGAALYNNYETIVARAGLLITRKSLLVVAPLFLAMVGVSLTSAYSANTQWALATNAVMAACMSTVLILYLVTNNLRIRPLIGLGRFSYTLYITHFPSIFVYLTAYYYFSNAAPPYIYNNLFFIPCIGFCLLIAFCQYSLVEKRTKYLLDRLRKKETRPEILPPPVAATPVTEGMAETKA